MKLLVKIGPIEVARNYTDRNGQQREIYGVMMRSGDDYLKAETFLSHQGMERRGIVEGAVGTAKIDFELNQFENRQTGKKSWFQKISLVDFTLANQNITPSEQAPAEQAPQEEAQPAPDAPVAPATEAKVEGEGSNLPF